MTDLVERLRTLASGVDGDGGWICHAAAKEIERLRKISQRLVDFIHVHANHLPLDSPEVIAAHEELAAIGHEQSGEKR